MNKDSYIINSLELHLFFGRIMKEHSLFLEAGFTPPNSALAERAEHFKKEFENLLCKAVSLSNGIISDEVLNSGEIFTEFTALAERQTEKFTGISINQNITNKEQNLSSNIKCRNISENYRQVKQLNQIALKLLNGLISFKEEILRKVLHCEIFTMNYPLLIEHIIREAKLYREYVHMLEKNGTLNCHTMKEIECFWNQIMMEHAMFIRGLLDPSEDDLFDSANAFADEYSKLLEACRNVNDKILKSDSLNTTKRFQEFKTAGTKGIEQCKIRSVILPLLTDHVLREANHYIRLLEN